MKLFWNKERKDEHKKTSTSQQLCFSISCEYMHTHTLLRFVVLYVPFILVPGTSLPSSLAAKSMTELAPLRSLVARAVAMSSIKVRMWSTSSMLSEALLNRT